MLEAEPRVPLPEDRERRTSEDRERRSVEDRERRHRRRRHSSKSRSPSSGSSSPRRRRRHRERRERRHRSRDRSRDRDRDRKRRPKSPKSASPPPKPVLNPVEEALRREAEQADRDQRTVFASQIHPKTTMREIFEFFSQVGRVRDVQCIEDQRTRKFKGIAYVEMDSIETVPLALALNGHNLGGYPVNVQLTQAEKNRAAQQAALAAAALQEQPMRVRVQSLHPDVSSDDLRPFFEPFGRVDDCQVDLDEHGKSLGSAWVSFRRVPEAQAAVSSLNQLLILNQPIVVSMEVPLIGMNPLDFAMSAGYGSMGGSGASGMSSGVGMGQLGELDDDSGGGLHLSAQHRLALMQRLQRSENRTEPVQAPPTMPPTAPSQAAAPSVPVRIQPTTCIVLKNMFSHAEVAQDPELPLDIKEDVQSEASKYGRLLHIFVDGDSEGHVFLRYADVDSAMASLKDFNGRFFAGRQVLAEFVIERSYESRFPGSGKA